MMHLRSGGPGRQDWSTWPRQASAGTGTPVLFLGAAADPFAFPELNPLAVIFAGEVAVIEGGMVPWMEQLPEEVAEVITEFLS